VTTRSRRGGTPRRRPPPRLFGYVVTKQFGGQGLVFSLPYAQLAAFLVVAGVVGVLAAVLPARRAANLDVLAAVQYE
jgi:putative ABC transport system permease protein